MRPEPPRPVAPDNRGPATAVLVAALAVGLAAPSPAAVTTYRYDPLGNLVEVRQEAPGDEIQIRELEYDGLSRLIRETHPESGTTLYRYDRVGNLVEKRDARGVNTHLAYDALNRPLSKSFSPSATYPESFAYEYDQPVTNGTGRLFRVRELRGGTVEGESLFLYDELGRVISEERRTFGIHAAAQYTYNAAGARTRILWPASLNQPDTADLFRTFEYDDQLRTTRVVFGDGVDPGTLLVDSHTFELTSTGATETTWVLTDQRRYRETLTYNLRFQPIRHRVVDESSNQTLLDLAYDYGGNQNNGSLRARTDHLRPRFSLTFSYDGVDRLIRTDHSGSLLSDPWHVRYVYDRFGNRTDTPIGGAPPNGFNPLENITYTGNRSDTWLYDAAGNQIGNNLTDPPIAIWDGDNRVTQVRNTAQGVASYFYDSEGRRVRKTTSSGTRTYFRDPGGDVLLEWLGENDADRMPDVARVFAGGKLRFTWNAADPAPGGTHVVFPDYLGSPVLKIDWDTDAVLADAYYPFGQQLNAPADAYHSHRFTGQERDAETGLVYFGARYYQDAAARFVSVDPALESGKLQTPQTWNRYLYARNNPLKFIDPNGRQEESAFTYQVPEANKKKTGDAWAQARYPHKNKGIYFHITLDNGDKDFGWTTNSQDIPKLLKGVKGAKISSFRLAAHHSVTTRKLWGTDHDRDNTAVTDDQLIQAFREAKFTPDAQVTLQMCNGQTMAEELHSLMGPEGGKNATLIYTEGTNADIPGTGFSVPAWVLRSYGYEPGQVRILGPEPESEPDEQDPNGPEG